MDKPVNDPCMKANPAVVEVKLGGLGRRLETANFLLEVASAAFVYFSVVAAVIAYVLEFGWGRLTIPANILSLGLPVFGLCAGLSLLWAVAIARMWRWSIFVGSIVCALALALEHLASDTVSVDAILIRVIAFLFLFQLMAAGWRIARSSENDRSLFTVVPVGALGVAQTLARAMGVSPVCRWVPHRGRRIAAALLFVLASLAVGVTMAWLLNLEGWMPEFGALVVAASCAVDQPFYDGCWERMVLVAFLVGQLALTGGFVGVAVLLRLAARRFARVSLQNLEMSDKRPPLLFLRSFHDDQVRLSWPKRPIIERLFALGEPRPMLDHLLVEEGSVLGPVIAVGMPSKPAPFGAPRIFFDDQTWRNAVRDMAEKAQAIVIVADNTSGVQWELALIRDAGHAGKTLYLLPPALSAPDQGPAILLRETNAVAELESNIIGWYPSGDTLNVLTDEFPSRSSYVIGLRLFIRTRFAQNIS